MKLTFWNKLLNRMFMCHQIPSRSFFYKGKQFPICARCTGLLIGYILFIPIAFLIGFKGYMILLILPMVIDGSIQSRTRYESKNGIRLITGILGGIAILYMIFAIFYFGYMHGRAYAENQLPTSIMNRLT
ncbi:DUF2085 domain-containing protein [Haloplasma contractile]|uniref:Membrane protein n=1 Tax=Haloplasma contractile SSD-17B TaxID=1033810 RepID=U2FQB9_9MOLU|nr:DUF2085 domain-containing protein [Haloplasma contractile]ERJ13234.1 putative membrane protein [Haloplasma contractile SSD-17B]